MVSVVRCHVSWCLVVLSLCLPLSISAFLPAFQPTLSRTRTEHNTGTFLHRPAQSPPCLFAKEHVSRRARWACQTEGGGVGGSEGELTSPASGAFPAAFPASPSSSAKAEFSRRFVAVGGAAAWLAVLHPLPAMSASAPVGPKLPASAYVMLNNGMTICRLQTGLLQLSPKTTRLKGSREEDEKYWEVDKTRAIAAMKQLVDAGLTTFDLAGVYGDAEDIVGDFVREYGRIEGVSFNTKWIPTGSSPKSREEVKEAVERARGRMGGAAGLVQFYWWDYDKPYYVPMLLHAQSLTATNALDGIGLTGFDFLRVSEVVRAGVRVAQVQGSFSLLDTRARDGGLAGLCARNQIAFVAHGTLMGGFLSQRWLGAAEPEEGGRHLPTSQLRKYYRWLREWGSWDLFQTLLSTLKTIADDKNVSVSNVALKWVLLQPGVASAIVGGRLGSAEQAEEAQENRRVLSEAWTLSPADLRAIAQVQEQGKPLMLFLGDVGNEFHVKARGIRNKKPKAAAAQDLPKTDAKGT